MPTALVPAIYDAGQADDNVWVETEDAYQMVRRLAREEGLLVGLSSGANLVAARAIARSLVEKGGGGNRDDPLRRGEKYLSEEFWNDPIEKEAWDRMLAHARSAYPNECCGAMLGEAKTATRQFASPCRWTMSSR
jgi:hypothetical protein